jgi:hypothetical protein
MAMDAEDASPETDSTSGVGVEPLTQGDGLGWLDGPPDDFGEVSRASFDVSKEIELDPRFCGTCSLIPRFCSGNHREGIRLKSQIEREKKRWTLYLLIG